MLCRSRCLFYNKKTRINIEKNFEYINFVLNCITYFFVHNNKYVLIIKQNMFRQQFMSFVKYLFIKKQNENYFTSEQEEALQKI